MQKQSNNIKWYILGAGAIGCLWATKFSRQNIPSIFLKRQQNDKAVNDNKTICISLIDLEGNRTSHHFDSVAIDKSDGISYLLVCTKSYQTEAAIKSISAKLAHDATIVLLQNGMGQQQLVRDCLVDQNILVATTTEGALIESKNQNQHDSILHLKHTGDGVSYFGKFDKKDTLVAEVQSSLAKINMILKTDINHVILNKLAINCVINPLSALHNCANGELYKSSQILAKVEKLSAEVDKVMTALTAKPTDTLQNVLSVAKATENNFSSMHQDIAHQRKTEISFINGFLQQQSNRLNIETLYNQQVIEQIQNLERTFNR